jgi:peptidoglycan/xylan/chitin deacetylase (PgdA/CDA1 family)
VTPDPGLERLLAAHVAQHGGAAFFERSGWREELHVLTRTYRASHPPSARREDAAALRERLAGELRGSREALEAITGRPVRFMCWPNGGTCEAAFELLAETGYLAATLPSRAKQPVNRRGSDPSRIGRISATSFFRGTEQTWPWVLSFALKVERNRGIGWAELPIKAIWLYRRVVPPSGGRPIGGEI